MREQRSPARSKLKMDAKLQQNVEDQLTRLLTQLQDCEDLKADLDPEEVSGAANLFMAIAVAFPGDYAMRNCVHTALAFAV